jgi:hypothetical protein
VLKVTESFCDVLSPTLTIIFCVVVMSYGVMTPVYQIRSTVLPTVGRVSPAASSWSFDIDSHSQVIRPVNAGRSSPSRVVSHQQHSPTHSPHIMPESKAKKSKSKKKTTSDKAQQEPLLHDVEFDHPVFKASGWAEVEVKEALDHKYAITGYECKIRRCSLFQIIQSVHHKYFVSN